MTSLAVMTFNLRYGSADDGAHAWEQRRPLVLDVLREGSPDLVATQEGLNWQLDDIQAGLPGWRRLGVGRDDGAGGGEHNAILYDARRWRWLENGTHWLSDSPDSPGSRSWGNRLPRICTWALMERDDGARVWLENLHLDHESGAARLRSAQLVAQRAKARAAQAPLIVAGDLNVSPGDPALEALLEPSAGLTHAFDGRWPGGSFHGFTGSSRGPLYDHILISAGLEVLDVEVDRRRGGGTWPSDHFPITARLRLRS